MGSYPIFIAIVGGSGSGKSWLAKRLQACLRPLAARISLDAFYKDRSHLSAQRQAKLNFDHPAAIDWRMFRQALRDLSKGRNALVPSYDFRTHSRAPRLRTAKPKPFILVDGLWLLRNPAIRRFFSFRIFLHCSACTRLRRRLKRDLACRGRTHESILLQFKKTVEPMHAQYVAPQICRADLVLRGKWGAHEANQVALRVRNLTR